MICAHSCAVASAPSPKRHLCTSVNALSASFVRMLVANFVVGRTAVLNFDAGRTVFDSFLHPHSHRVLAHGILRQVGPPLITRNLLWWERKASVCMSMFCCTHAYIAYCLSAPCLPSEYPVILPAGFTDQKTHSCASASFYTFNALIWYTHVTP